MIVVGGWPGRNVVGLNGAFGVRPGAFSTGGSFANPLLNDVDAGDTTTEFVLVVSSLPGSGTVTLDDYGGFSHTGAADGSYTTTATLYTWAQGGPITQHSTPESISSVFGTATTFTINAAGLASALAFGSATFNPAVQFTLAGSGLASTLAYGAGAFVADGTFAITPVGLSSTLTFGQARLVFEGNYVPDAKNARRLVVTVDPRLQGTSLPGSGGPLLQPYPFAPGSHLDIEWDWRDWMDQGDALDTFSVDWDGDAIGALDGSAEGLGVVRTWLTVPPEAVEGSRALLLCTVSTFEGRIDSRKYELIVKQL